MLTFSRFTTPRRSSHRLIVAAAAVAVLSGCKALTSVDASFENVSDTLTFFAINGSPPGAPTAVNLFTGVPYHADQAFAYDIAFDIDSTGKVVLIPARVLATQISTPYSVGLQALPGIGFNELDHAPKDGYKIDSLVTVGINTVVAIESFDIGRCRFAIKGQTYFSKLIVTDIDRAARKITTTIAVNRNCGFRSFEAGKPKD